MERDCCFGVDPQLLVTVTVQQTVQTAQPVKKAQPVPVKVRG